VTAEVTNVRRALVIDEDETWRRALLRGLSGRGLVVLGAPSCRRGIELARYEGPDVVILELQLPDGHGLRVLPRLRRLCPDAAIIICTAYGSIAAAIAAVRAGAHDFLVKPTTIDQVSTAIKNATTFLAGRSPARIEVPSAPMSLARIQWEHIQRVLMESAWNVSEAARRLGIHRQSLQRRLRQQPALGENNPASERMSPGPPGPEALAKTC
jgi:two-component system, response regulator RegA